MRKLLQLSLAVTILFGALGSARLFAQEEKPAEAEKKSKLQQLTEGLKKEEGMMTLYHNDQRLLGVIKSSDLDKNFIVLTSIARGISSGMVIGGMTWGFGDDIIWSFKKVGENIHVLRRNVRFKAKSGTPEADAVKLAYSDSVLYALPILCPADGGDLVDLSRIFMSDDPQIGREIGAGFSFRPDRSTWAKVKAFPENMELQVAAVYAGMSELETVSDPRGVQVNVHYSISRLPSNGFKPRKADDRVGYFLTVLKDFSDTDDDQHFVRYINRWDLQKEDPNAKLSRPKKPIRFYIEKTVPMELRPYVQEGFEEWNKAFEKFGYYKAIEVLQQDESDDWDPEDIRYNTFRWITAEAGFAMGPSRVNPMTGEILDADIIFDASFLRYWKSDYETFTAQDARRLMGFHAERENVTGHRLESEDGTVPFLTNPGQHGFDCMLSRGMQQQMGFAAAALMTQGATNEKGDLPEEFIQQALKEVVMHEVGHTLGLRHNFKASGWKDLAALDGTEAGVTGDATVASVMDYSPPNIAPKGVKQGHYYTPTIGPYDYWAIEYGYSSPTGTENDELAKIAAKGAEDGHDYATDEDTRFVDSDPLSNRFDLGKNPLQFAERQMKIASELMPTVVDRAVKDGEGYQRARQAFGMLFSEYWRTAYFASRVPGGIHVHRDHKADPNSRDPFKLVDPAQQRAAMKLLAETAFGSPKYDPATLNKLAASRWSHWGVPYAGRLDYPIHQFVEMMQAEILFQLINSMTLNRLHDGELKVAADADSYTLAEHLQTLNDSVFTEWKGTAAAEHTNRNPYISSFRRNLQRMTLKELGYIVTSGFGYPEDARTLARMHLETLDKQATALLENQQIKLDDYSRAHLLDSQNRVRQVLTSKLEVRSID